MTKHRQLARERATKLLDEAREWLVAAQTTDTDPIDVAQIEIIVQDLVQQLESRQQKGVEPS